MKTKLTITLTMLSTVFTMHCCETNNNNTTDAIICRPATLNDLKAISKISEEQYQKTFKPIWEKYYATITPSHHTIDSFVKEKATLNKTANKNFINSTADQKVLIAELRQKNWNDSRKTSFTVETKTVGYCRFEKKDAQTMYINFIVVAEEFRKRGIAKQLAQAAMNTFDDVTTCKFRALAHNDFVNDLYTQHGCEQTGTVSLDASTGKISTDPNAPITHIDYSYTIKK